MNYVSVEKLLRFWNSAKAFVSSSINNHNIAVNSHSSKFSTIESNISNLQSETATKWTLLNTVDNRSNTNTSNIAKINKDISDIKSSDAGDSKWINFVSSSVDLNIMKTL